MFASEPVKAPFLCVCSDAFMNIGNIDRSLKGPLSYAAHLFNRVQKSINLGIDFKKFVHCGA